MLALGLRARPRSISASETSMPWPKYQTTKAASGSFAGSPVRRSFSGSLAASLLGNRAGPVLDFRVVRTAAWEIAEVAARTRWQSSVSQSSDGANSWLDPLCYA